MLQREKTKEEIVKEEVNIIVNLVDNTARNLFDSVEMIMRRIYANQALTPQEMFDGLGKDGLALLGLAQASKALLAKYSPDKFPEIKSPFELTLTADKIIVGEAIVPPVVDEVIE